jgi:hypothetical protein
MINDVTKEPLSEGKGQVSRIIGDDVLVGLKTCERSFELPNAVLYAVGNVLNDIGGYGKVQHFRFALQNSETRLEVGYLDVGAEPPLKSGQKTLLNAYNLLGWPVGAKDDLFAILIQCVEDVKEFFLRLLLPTEKLHIINNENIDLAVELGKL